MSKPQKAAQAEGYLERENYYQKNSEIGYFRGAGLKHLGLKQEEPVTPELYKALLNGFNPTTGEKLHSNSGDKQRLAGIDVTFSSPKSVSILMEALEARGDFAAAFKLRKAHEKSVKSSMNKIEKRYVKTRERDTSGKRIKVSAQMVSASFEHDVTRETDGNIDPQLHTHNFIFYTTFYEDPSTGEVKSLSLSNKEIYANKMYLGQSYRNDLARNLNELGYEIEVSEVLNGFFELKSFEKEHIDEFSGRSKSIKAHMEKYREKYPNMNESQLKEIIAQEIKGKKKEVDRDEVREKNADRLLAVGIDDRFIDKIQTVEKEREEPSQEIKEDHVKKVLVTLTDKNSTFSIEDFMRESLKYGLEYTMTEIDYIKILTKDENVIKLDDNVYSTQKMIDDEMSIIDGVIEGKDSQEPYISDTFLVDVFIDKNYSNMTAGQREMMIHILTTRDQMVAVQGDAGTGKTYSVKGVRELIEENKLDIDVEGIVFTGKATAGLEADSGIKSKTIHSFIYGEQNRKEKRKPKLLIIDESGMVGSKQVAELVKIARENGDKLVFIGDTKQFKSISAGRAFADMQKYGISTVYMGEVMRHKTDLTKQSVNLLKEQDVKGSLEKIEAEGKYHELDNDAIISDISKNFVSLSKKKRRGQLIITSRNDYRKAINGKIRAGLELEGDKFQIRENINLQGIAAHYNSKYEKGMIVAIQGKIEGFQQGQVLEIVGRSTHSKKIIVKPQGGTREQERELNVFNHGDKLQVYKDSERTFEKGDLIIFTKNTTLSKEKRMEVKNGDRAYIKSIDGEGNIVTENGKKFNINKMPYLDHGYAVTDVKSQGSTTDHVVIMADAQMANYNSFYTQLTRPKYDITLYTDSKEQLLANVEKDLEEKSTLNYTLNKDGTKKQQIGVQKHERDEEIFRRDESRAERAATVDGVSNTRDREESPSILVEDSRPGEDHVRTADAEQSGAQGTSSVSTSDIKLDTGREWRGKSSARAIGKTTGKIGIIIERIKKIIEQVEHRVEDLKSKRLSKTKMKKIEIKKTKEKKEQIKSVLEKDVKIEDMGRGYTRSL